MRGCSCEGEFNSKNRAFAKRTIDFDRSVVLLNDPLRNCETKASAT